MIRALVIAMALVVGAPAAAALEPQGAPLTRWPEGTGRREITPQTWEAAHPTGGPLQVHAHTESTGIGARRDSRGRVAVLVEASIADGLQDALDQFVADLTVDGYDVVLEVLTGGDSAELRTHLVDLDATEQLVGALLVGALPVAWYEIEDDHNEYGYVIFPCDLFYMDLDGSWVDDDGNDVPDRHEDGEGDTRPEIWIGRLLATADMGDEVELIADYLARNHAFRRGEILPTRDALVYVDDDWAEWTDWYADEVDAAFPQVTSEADANTTCAGDYQGRLTGGYDAVALYVHSSPDAHFFVRQGVYDTLTYDQIPEPADALFYNLFACAAANYADHVYMAGVYTLQTDHGLIAVGSTKTGSMLSAGAYYDDLAGLRSFGDAFVGWFRTLAPYDFGEICWSYGMTLIGDPTLRIGYPTLQPDVDEVVADTRDLAPLSVEITVDNGGLDDLEWSAGVDGTWLSVEPSSGLAGDAIEMILDPTGLALGHHLGELRIDAPGATNHPLSIPVDLAVLEPAQICVEPDPLEVYLVRGEGAVDARVELRNCRDGRMAWSVRADATWVELPQAEGETRDDVADVPVTFQVPGPRDGRHEAVLIFSSPDAEHSPLELPVVLRVGPAGCEGCGVDGGGSAGAAGIGLLMALLLLTRRRS